MRILLASASPRRKEILSQIIADFEVESVSSDEGYIGVSPEDTVIEIARRKLFAVNNRERYEVVITCDTLVFLEGKYFGKPQSRLDAERMLRELSGRTHKVISGLVVLFKNKIIEKAVFSEVTFKNLSDDDIATYLDTYEYSDKAGAYAIQDKVLVKEVSGSYYNVVGLPKEELEIILTNIFKGDLSSEKQ